MPHRPEFVLPTHVHLEGNGIHLREWNDDDLPAMAELFDDPAIDRWTPLPSPFGLDAARDYLAKARLFRIEGRRLHLAITTDGRRPRGEILLFPSENDSRDIELGYGVGARHRRLGLASRAVELMTEYAHGALAARRVLLRIEPGNVASAAVARSAGFRLTDDEPIVREAKGRRVVLDTWSHHGGRTTMPR